MVNAETILTILGFWFASMLISIMEGSLQMFNALTLMLIFFTFGYILYEVYKEDG